MGHMQHGGQHIELPRRKAQQQAEAHIAHTGAQRHLRRVEALLVMALGPGHMGGLVVVGVVGILIDQDGAHVSIQQHAVLVGVPRPHVDVDAADFAVTVEHGVHDADGFGQVLHIGIGQLAGDQHDALVPLTDQLAGGLAHLGRGHVLALDERIALAVGAVEAFTAAMVLGPTIPSTVTPSNLWGILTPCAPDAHTQSTRIFATDWLVIKSAFHLSQYIVFKISVHSSLVRFFNLSIVGLGYPFFRQYAS